MPENTDKNRKGKRELTPKSNRLCIVAYLHCAMCLKELLGGKSPQEFAPISVGYTRQGIQVWCNRHNCNITHIDFEGMKHPADNTANPHTEFDDKADLV